MDLDELLDKHYYKKKEKELKEKSGEDKGLPRIENHKRIKMFYYHFSKPEL